MCHPKKGGANEFKKQGSIMRNRTAWCMMPRARLLDGQLAFELFEQPKPRNPFDCPDAATVVDIGGGKTYCEPWQTWTNCREAGHCVFAAWRDSQK